MSIVRKVKAVERLFLNLEKEIGVVKNNTGLHCASNCVACCTKKDLKATALEFYPLALHLYKTGQAEDFLTYLQNYEDDGICPMLNQFQTENKSIGCSHYEYRGLICRLFGYSSVKNRLGEHVLSTCKTIKSNYPAEYRKADELARKNKVPAGSDYFSRLQFIDYNQAYLYYPVKDAIRIAVETIVTYYHYRGKKVS